VCSGVRVNISKLLQRRMQVATKNVGERKRLPIAGLKEESASPGADELVQQFRDIGMKIDLAIGADRFQPPLHLSLSGRFHRRSRVLAMSPLRWLKTDYAMKYLPT